MAITGGWMVLLAVSLSLASTQRTGVISHHLVNSVLTPRITPKSASVLRTQQRDIDKALTSSFLSAKFPIASGSFPRRSGTVRIRLNNPTWRSTAAIRARRKYPIPWSTWRRTARDSRDVVVRRHQLLALPTTTSLLPRRTTSSLSTSPNSVTSRIMRFRLPSLRQMVSHVLRAVTRGSSAVTRGSSAVARESSAVTRGSSAVTRGSSAVARGPQAIARTSSTVGRGSSAITRGFPAAPEGSGPAASSASGSEVGTEALPAALPLGGFASAAGSASPVKSLFGVPSDDPYYAILTTLTEPFPALPPSVKTLLRRRTLAVAAARASVAAGQSRTGGALTRTAAGASSLGQTAAGAPRLGQVAAAAAASSVGQTAAGTSGSGQTASGALRLGQAATAASSLTQTASAASSLTQTASGAQSLTQTASGAQSVGQTASGTSPRQIPGSTAVVEGPEIQAESSSDVLRIMQNVHSQAQNLASPVFGVLEAVERVVNLLDRQAQKQAQPACTGSQARAGSRLNEQGEEDDENCRTEQVGTSRDSPASQAASSANDTASSTGDSASSIGKSASSTDDPASSTGSTASPTGSSASLTGSTASSTGDSALPTGSTASPTGSTASPTGSTASSADDTASSTDDSASSDDDTASASSDPTSTSIATLLFSRGIPVLTASPGGVKVTLLNRSNKLVCDLAAGYSLDLTTNKVVYSGLDPTTSRSTAPRGGGPTFYTVSVDPHLGLLSLEPVAVNVLDLMRAVSAQKTSTSELDPGFLGSVLGAAQKTSTSELDPGFLGSVLGAAQKTSTSELDPGFLGSVLGAGAKDSAGREVEATTTPLMETTTVVDSQVESEEGSVSEDLETEETTSPSANAGVQSGTQALSSSQDVDDSGAQTQSTTRSSLPFPADSQTQSGTQPGSSSQDADYESQEQSGVQTISAPQTTSQTPPEMPAESSSQELDSQTKAYLGSPTTSTPPTDSESSHAPSATARDSSTASTPSLKIIPANSETETEEGPEAEEPETEDTTPDLTSAWTESTLDSGSSSRTTDSQVQMQSGVTETAPQISSTPLFSGEETSLLTQSSSTTTATTANAATSTSIPPLETIPLDYDGELEETAEAEEYEMWETTPASTSIGTTTSSSSLANNPLWVALTSNNPNLFNVTSEDLAEVLKILLKGSTFTGTSSMAPAEAGVVNDVTVGSDSAGSASV